MSAPKRLIEEGTAIDRALLRAGRDDRPSADYERRVLAASSAVTIASASALARPTLFARLARPRTVIVAAIAASAAVFATRERTSSPKMAASPVMVEAPVSPPAEPRLEEPESEPVVAVATPDSLPSAPPPSRLPVLAKVAPPSPPVAPAPKIDPVPAQPVAGSSLHREVELLDAVKRSLRTGTPADAARALDAYDAEFPNGTLKPESGFLRIRVLLAKGDRAAAVALGDELLSRHPNSVHAKRIRAALAADSTLPR
ncbi:MAG: hypothetical protein K0S65_855 [Labilithrix sp.]|nr:hypothetical protein [Labilithrix sp.]